MASIQHLSFYYVWYQTKKVAAASKNDPVVTDVSCAKICEIYACCRCVDQILKWVHQLNYNMGVGTIPRSLALTPGS